MLLPSTNDSHHLAKAQKSHDEINTYSHLIKHLTTDKDARKLTILLVINLLCAILEVIYGLLSNSIGLLSDSAHMLFDSTALAVGIYASYKATLPANSKFSYGFDRFQTLSGLINGIFLIFIGFYIFIESLERMYNPPVIHCSKMIVVAIVGLIVNVVGVTFFHEHAHFGEDHGHAHGSGCSHSHGKKEKKAVKNHSHGHSHKDHAKAIAGHSHSHHHDHVDNNVSSIHHVESSNSVPSTLNSIKEDDQSHSHSHTHDHSTCNHGHNSQQPDHHTQHHCSHDEKSQAHTHAHTHIHEHKHEHSHHEHEEHDHEHEHEHDHGHDHHHNENLYGVFLHILADLLGSVGVITSSILIMLFDWYVADAICSAITSLLILASVVPLIKSSIMVFLQTYPAKYKKSFHHALSEISNHPSVIEFKDAHLWAYTQSRLVCSVVLVVRQNTTDTNSIVEYARKKLKTIKNIEYMTIDCRAEGQI